MIGTASRVNSRSVAVRNRQVGRMAARKAYRPQATISPDRTKTTPIGAVHLHPFSHIVGVMFAALALVFGAGLVGAAIPSAAIPAAVFAGVVLAGSVIAIICSAGYCLQKVWR